MPKRFLAVSAWLIVQLAFPVVQAADLKPGTAGLPKGIPTAPFRLNPSHLPSTRMVVQSVTAEQVKRDCGWTQTSNFDRALPRQMASVNACRTQAYTAQDQARAGCHSSDSVAQCSRKLYNYCMTHGSVQAQIVFFRAVVNNDIQGAQKCRTTLLAYSRYLQHVLRVYGGPL